MFHSRMQAKSTSIRSPVRRENENNISLNVYELSVCLGTVQEGISSMHRSIIDLGTPTNMGAPLILTMNRNSSPETPKPTVVEEATPPPPPTHSETPEHQEDNAIVNGKLDIAIKDNSINEAVENHTTPNQQLDFRHNYH